MNKFYGLFIILFLVYSQVAPAQYYSVDSFDDAHVIFKNSNKKRALEYSDIESIRLKAEDSLIVNSGELSIYKLSNKNDVRFADPGRWSVKTIWEGKAVSKSKRPNCKPSWDVPKGGERDSLISFDFIILSSENDKEVFSKDNIVHGKDIITSMIIGNHSNDLLYAYVYWVVGDTIFHIYKAIEGDEKICVLQPNQDNYFLLTEAQLITKHRDSEICVCYTRKKRSAPELPTYAQKQKFIDFMKEEGFDCEHRDIYYHE